MKSVLLSHIKDFQNYTKSKTISDLRQLYSQISKKDEKQIWWSNPPKVNRAQLLSVDEVLQSIQLELSARAKK